MCCPADVERIVASFRPGGTADFSTSSFVVAVAAVLQPSAEYEQRTWE